MATTGEKIKRILASQGKNQKDLAKALHVTAQTVSHWVNDGIKTTIRKTNLEDIANYLGVPVDELQPDNTEEEELNNFLNSIKQDEDISFNQTDYKNTKELREQMNLEIDEFTGTIQESIKKNIEGVLSKELKEYVYHQTGDKIKKYSNQSIILKTELHKLKEQQAELIKFVKRLQMENKQLRSEIRYIKDNGEKDE